MPCILFVLAYRSFTTTSDNKQNTNSFVWTGQS